MDHVTITDSWSMVDSRPWGGMAAPGLKRFSPMVPLGGGVAKMTT
jgi:hypothetical protein